MRFCLWLPAAVVAFAIATPTARAQAQENPPPDSGAGQDEVPAEQEGRPAGPAPTDAPSGPAGPDETDSVAPDGNEAADSGAGAAPLPAAAEDGSRQPTQPGDPAPQGAIVPRPFVPGMIDLPKRRGFGWDAEFDLAIRLFDTDDANADLLFGRLQLGALYVNEPFVFALGLTGELGGLPKRGIGGQASVTHMRSGLWAHVGASSGLDDAAIMSLAAGITVFGLEWQVSVDGDDGSESRGSALFLELRVPIGTTFFFLTREAEQ